LKELEMRRLREEQTLKQLEKSRRREEGTQKLLKTLTEYVFMLRGEERQLKSLPVLEPSTFKFCPSKPCPIFRISNKNF